MTKTLPEPEAESPEHPDDSIFTVLYDVARLYRRDFQRRTRIHGTTRTQWHVLVTLARHIGIRQINLADLLEIEPITLVRILDRLEEAGLVERRPDPTDRRARTLHLTKAASPLLEQMRIVAEQARAIGLSGLTKAEQAALLLLLQKIRVNIRSALDEEGPLAGKSEKDVSHG